MSNKSALMFTILILILLVVGFVYIKKHPNQYFDYSHSNQTNQLLVSPSPQTQNQTMITITKDGISPSSVTIKMGESITFANSDTVSHSVYSSPVKTHTDYPPLNVIGLLKSGEKKDLMFPDQGTYKFQDDANSQFSGTITVE